MRAGKINYEKFLHVALVTWCSAAMLRSGAAMSIASNGEWLRHNGTAWIVFGPAVFGACKRIDLHVRDDGDYHILAGSPSFVSIREWVRKKFEQRVNESPVVPSYKAVYFPIYLDLYSDERGERGDLLLKIPLTTQMLDLTNDAFQLKLSDLKNSMVRANR